MRRLFSFLAGCATLAVAAPAWAQGQSELSGSSTDGQAVSGTGEGIADIVVTAQRREQSLQSVPIAVQAFSSERLAVSGIETTADLAMVTPGLVVQRGVGLSSPFLRGIGTAGNGPGVESAVATYVDGVYYASKAGSMSDLANVERVEVLKGPQGTLFGRNATGGLIQIITRDPSATPGFTAKVGYQNYDTVTANGYLTGGLTENVAADVTVSYRNQGKGWGTNSFTGSEVNMTDNFLVRSKVLIEPNSDTRIVLAGDYNDYKTDTGINVRFQDGVLAANGLPYVGDRYGVQNSFDQFFHSKAGGLSLTATHNLNDDITLTSITSYRRTDYEFLLDADAMPANTIQFETDVRERQFTHELQLSGGSSGSLEWTAGGYYFDGKSRQSIFFSGAAFPGLLSRGVFGGQSVRAYAAYAQLTYPLAQSTRLTLGARYNSENRSLSGDVRLTALDGTVTVPQIVPDGTDARFNKLTWRVSLDHDLTQDVLLYASYNRGFRSGGFNPSNFANPPFRPEVLDAFELGLKSSFLDRKVRLNIAAFYYDFRDIQLGQFVLGVQTIRNAARAEVYGVDLDAEVRVTPRLRLTGSMAYLDGKYLSFPGAGIATPLPGGGNVVVVGDASGNRMMRAPRVTANLAVDYSLPLSGDWSADMNVTYSHTGKFFWEPDNFVFEDPYSLVNAKLTFNYADRHKISFWGRNITDKFYSVASSAPTLGSVLAPGEPRTYGVTFETRF